MSSSSTTMMTTSGSVDGSGAPAVGPCGACKFLRRKCVEGCVFAPYFDQEQGAAHFAAVHKVFGASNVSKLLLHIPSPRRPDAVATICYEAQARLRDPVYGCVAHIFALQQQVVNLQTELAYLQAHLTTLEVPTPPPPPPPQPTTAPPPLSISDLPSASVPPLYDLSCFFEPMGQQQQQPLPWPIQAQAQTSSRPGPSGPGDLQALARELVNRHGSSSVSVGLCSDPMQPASLTK
ncbi:hypothetical protein V2J09_015244 [Rumex salicifolius]